MARFTKGIKPSPDAHPSTRVEISNPTIEMNMPQCPQAMYYLLGSWHDHSLSP